MLRREGAVKWLDAERGAVAREPVGVHECDGAESSNVAVVERSSIVENELDRRVPSFLVREIAGVDEQRAGESRLHHETIARRQVDHNELCSSPGSRDASADDACSQCSGPDLAEDVAAADVNGDDRASRDLAIEVAGNGLGLRK